jgi:predicted dehydrogenase
VRRAAVPKAVAPAARPGRGAREVGPEVSLRAGIVGTGFAASSHADALARLPGAVLAGVAGSSAAKARAAAERFGAERAYPDYQALLADPAIGVVHDCTPNHLHAAVNSAALAAGKHVLSEKPLGVNSRETTALVRQAAAARGVSGVCFNYRHFPLVAQARAVIAAQEIGPVHLVHGGYLQDWLLFAGDWNWRLESGQAGPARAVGDIGSHWLDLVQYITGDKVAAVMADMSILHASRWRPVGSGHTFEGAGAPGGPAGAGEGDSVAVDTEDAASVLLRFASGAKGTMTVSQVSAGRKNRLFFEINAARASLAWDQEEPNQLWIGRRDRENADLARDPSLLSPEAAALARYPGGHQEGWPDALRNLFEDFYRAAAARDRDEPYQGSFATFPSAHQIALIVEAVLRSHRSGAWAAVEDGPDEEDST